MRGIWSELRDTNPLFGGIGGWTGLKWRTKQIGECVRFDTGLNDRRFFSD